MQTRLKHEHKRCNLEYFSLYLFLFIKTTHIHLILLPIYEHNDVNIKNKIKKMLYENYSVFGQRKLINFPFVEREKQRLLLANEYIYRYKYKQRLLFKTPAKHP